MPWLAGFGILHGTHEWVEMFLTISRQLGQLRDSGSFILLETGRHGLLAISFLCLLEFGRRLLRSAVPVAGRPLVGPLLNNITLMCAALYIGGWGVIWFILQPEWGVRLVTVDSWTRWSTGLPGTLLTAYALLLERRTFVMQGKMGIVRNLTLAALAFLWYAVFAHILGPKTPYLLSAYVNSEVFLETVGIPTQVFRAVMAAVAAVCLLRVMREFELDRQRRLQDALAAEQQLKQRMEALNRELREAARELSTLYEELRQRDEIRLKLLERVVRAQEEERQRVARDLHDTVGQVLSAIIANLATLENKVCDDHAPARAQVHQMQEYASQALDELHRLITDLRPALLDELGLVAALRWYPHYLGASLPFGVDVQVHGPARRLPPEIEIILFRIAQEALTNVMRHAHATQVTVTLDMRDDSQVTLVVEDNGCGFDVGATLAPTREQRPWGLLGMQERAELVGGTCVIASQLGQGTRVVVTIPLTPREKEVHYEGSTR
jgi:signal transduction histidine kinase